MLTDTDFPGGNGIITMPPTGEIEVRPDLRDTIGNWFYWCVRVRECAGQRLRVRIVGDGSVPIGVRGPAVSLDAGDTWRWLGAAAVSDGTFELDVPPACAEVRLSVGMPYTARNLETFLTRHQGRAGLTRRELTRSEHGRSVDLVTFGCTHGGAAARVLLTCRHHSCEMMASYVLEGSMARVLVGEDAAARWLRENVEFVVVPFVDTDGVEAGDQGKNRAPHDHGRDYGPAEGRYSSIRAIRRLLSDPAVPPFDVVLDLHCPNITPKPTNQQIYFVGSPDERNWASVEVLAEELESSAVGPLLYRRASNLPFGTAWNVAANFVSRDERAIAQQSIGWFLDDLPGAGLHAILEFPYADVDGVEVNASTARAFGSDLARAIEGYLRATPSSAGGAESGPPREG